MAHEIPYSVVTVVLTPLDAEGQPQPVHTMVVSGIGAVNPLDLDELTIVWRPDKETGIRFTLIGRKEWV